MVKNVSNGPIQVVVTGEPREDLVPLFGPEATDLKPAPNNAFRLERFGDTMSGFLGLQLLDLSAGRRDTTIIFRATEAPARIALARGRDDIYVMDMDGSNLTNLTEDLDRQAREPDWSPDGQSEIYLMNADGSAKTRITKSDGFDGEPAWSPDGTKIALSSQRMGHQNPEIYVMDMFGANQTRLTDNDSHHGYADWSPDGSRIIFSSERDGRSEIYAMNGDGSNQVNLTNNPDDDEEPAWSPDGSKIAFVSNRGDDLGREIYVMDADGSNAVCVLNGAEDLTWSPGIVP